MGPFPDILARPSDVGVRVVVSTFLDSFVGGVSSAMLCEAAEDVDGGENITQQYRCAKTHP
jgi:hypothetical protein